MCTIPKWIFTLLGVASASVVFLLNLKTIKRTFSATKHSHPPTYRKAGRESLGVNKRLKVVKKWLVSSSFVFGQEVTSSLNGKCVNG